MTQYEHIKQMSVKEMAEFLTDIMANSYHQATKTLGINYFPNDDTLQKTITENIKYLESEVEEE